MANRPLNTGMSPSQGQQQIPIQPVESPILCSPWAEPTEYWVYDPSTGEASRAPGRRLAGYYFRTGRARDVQQLSMLAEENWEELPIVNTLREDVRRWRSANYEGATNVTRELLRHWWREDRYRRLFFCQLECVETLIYLAEIRAGGKRTRFVPRFADSEMATLRDFPEGADALPLTRYACKMATGSGKTIVMAMLTAWTLCNRGRFPSDDRFPSGVLVVCPNLTVKERLQVLRPENPDNYYAAFDLVPTTLRPLMHEGRVFVTNWHLFAPESEHSESGKSYVVVDKGPESPEAFAKRVLGDLYERAPLLVLNDEGHHAYRPKPIVPDAEGLAGEDLQRAKSDRDAATIWVGGLDTLNKACGIKFCVDMSATPFYIHGSGYSEGQPFPWIVDDFGLVDAIESGIVKIPRLPVSDATGRPDPKYFRLWQSIVDSLEPGDRLPGRARKPKPEAVWREAEGALLTLGAQYQERFRYVQEATPGQDRTPPAMIIVCDNTDIADVLYRNISGEQVIAALPDVADEEEDSGNEDEPTPARRRRGPRTKTVYGQGKVFPDLFSNREGFKPTIRIDTKMLAEAEAGDGQRNRREVAEQLRKVVGTVGKPGEPGANVGCVVSVAMLTEGWDANNVTHILGLRAFTSQLLCEQVVGRGLRRMDYTVNPETGLLREEYVDVYGIPFSVIPFKGRPTDKPAPEDRPQNHVKALEERAAYELKFPVVEGYAFALRKNTIRADVSAMQWLRLEPEHEPTAVFVKASVGYQLGEPSAQGPGGFVVHNRQEYYRSTHLQAIKFEIARLVVQALAGAAEFETTARSRLAATLQSRQQLFPQVLRIVDEYVRKKVDLRDQHPCELGLDRYVKQLVDRLLAAIEPDDVQGELPLMPILNRYKSVGTTADVDFKTVRQVYPTQHSHLDQVVTDSTWEGSAAFKLEQGALAGIVQCYARNDHLELTIPYEYLGVSHHYEPDFLVKLSTGVNLLLEIKGEEDNRDRQKHEAAHRWVSAVNNWGQLGRWAFHVCRDPQMLERELRYLHRKAYVSP